MAVVYLSISVILFMTLPFVREQKKPYVVKHIRWWEYIPRSR